ncbi:peritrophin type-A domain protein 2 [Danaus plexippus plexippus]|uniref:Peritrophin type-A domain protein 2 n=1 Tax=Danaus plexippus plexippus TaxID=278856 RepID=A0A212FL74_DANPL|nr:peritrophin type-A domain protein 2 [Danaus plexippus plexippus]
MAPFKSILILLTMSCLLIVSYGQVSQGGSHIDQGKPHVSQGGSHEDQGRVRRQAIQDPTKQKLNEDAINPKNWTTCDFGVTPTISCYNCNTRLICKPIGGLLKACNDPMRPFCNSGICSSTPTANCF